MNRPEVVWHMTEDTDALFEWANFYRKKYMEHDDIEDMVYAEMFLNALVEIITE